MIRRLALPQFAVPLRLTACFAAGVVLCASVSAQESRAPAAVSEGDLPLTIKAERMSGRPDRELILEKNVEMTRGDLQIESDRAHYDIVDDKVDAVGDVRINRAGNRFRGKELQLKIDTGEGFLDSPVYRLLHKNAQGSAERIEFESQDSATIIRGRYTTCEGPDPDWYLKSSRLSLDNEREMGVAKNAVLVFKGVPIAGTPHISFPLSEERLSGFLPATIATSTTGGLEITTPYYWNIASNRDLTLYPQYISRRGLMLGADARYLGETYSGEARTEFLDNDSLTGNSRYALSSLHRQSLAPGLSFVSDLNFASDDNYARDFALSRIWRNRPAVSRRLMTRNLQLNYVAADWTAMARLVDYQVLQDPNAPIAVPYSRVPQLTHNYFGFDDSGLSWNVASEFTRFAHPTREQGDRAVFNPRATYTVKRAAYFVRPSLSLHSTMYNLDQVADPAAMTAPTRMVPTASLDTGLTFERDASFFGRSATQTLEPRLFYTYTPYVRQDGLLYPNFDSAEADFNYAQVFRENRFVGNDRIGDTNQLTAALTTRFIEPGGAERIRLAVAQRFSFLDQNVLLNTTPIGTTDTRSDLLFLATGRITSELRLDTNLQYSQTLKEFNRVNFGTFWQPAPMKLLNVQYRRDIRNTSNDANTNFELFDISGQWPLSDRWYGVGRINYLIKEEKLGQSLVGVEYKADCWIFRMVGQRLPTAVGEINTTFYIQLEFNGLSALGTNPMRALRANVPGYQPLTQ